MTNLRTDAAAPIYPQKLPADQFVVTIRDGYRSQASPPGSAAAITADDFVCDALQPQYRMLYTPRSAHPNHICAMRCRVLTFFDDGPSAHFLSYLGQILSCFNADARADLAGKELFETALT